MGGPHCTSASEQEDRNQFDFTWLLRRLSHYTWSQLGWANTTQAWCTELLQQRLALRLSNYWTKTRSVGKFSEEGKAKRLPLGIQAEVEMGSNHMKEGIWLVSSGTEGRGKRKGGNHLSLMKTVYEKPTVYPILHEE
jgi:hypothetical protein